MDRSEVIERLIDVFREFGYEAATLSRISKATGLGRASLYHHFPGGKQEMAEAVLDYLYQSIEMNIIGALKSSAPPTERIEAMIVHLNQLYDCGRNACLLALFSLSSSSTFLRSRIESCFSLWIETLTQVLIEAGVPAELAHDRAEDTVIQVQGSLILSKGMGTPAPFTRVLAQLPNQLLNA